MPTKKLKIVAVSNHSCVRVHKQALPLLESGEYEIHLLAAKHSSFGECYYTFGHWLEVGQLNNFIKLHASTTDIFWVHNEPSWFVTLIKEICPDKPVILDVHDSFLARTTKEEADIKLSNGENPVRVSAEERNNFQLADGLVFPGVSFADLVKKEFKLSQPSIVLRSHVPQRLYRYNMQEWLGGLVYEGKVQTNTEGRVSHAFKYCDYKELAKECFSQGVDFHIYGARDDKEFMDIYKDIAIIHPPYVLDVLLRQISRHDWGLVGNLHPHSEWDYAMPNKLFEYVAAGVPVVALNAKECGEYVVEKGIGISVNSLQELTERWKEHTEIRKNLLKTRRGLNMEENIGSLKSLYEQLL